MFVKTEFNTIVNLAKFDKVKLELDVKQDSGDVLHIISAVSEEKIMPTGVNEHPKHVLKSEKLAEYKKDWKDLAEKGYDNLYNALSQGKTVFHLAPFYRGMEGKG